MTTGLGYPHIRGTIMPSTGSATDRLLAPGRRAWEPPALIVLQLGAGDLEASRRKPAAPAGAALGGLLKLNLSGDMHFQGNHDF
jgi:hypothetical protein